MRRVLLGACIVQTGVVFACVVAWPSLALVALAGLGILTLGLMPE